MHPYYMWKISGLSKSTHLATWVIGLRIGANKDSKLTNEAGRFKAASPDLTLDGGLYWEIAPK